MNHDRLRHSGLAALAAIATLLSDVDRIRGGRGEHRRAAPPPPPPNRHVPGMSRNARCHCGSGKKFKACCMVVEHAPAVIDTATVATVQTH